MQVKWGHTIPVEVYDITKYGFKLRIHGKEYYLEREIYRWFLNATDEEILNVSADYDDPDDHGDHLCWGLLNVDLGTKDLEDPTRFKYIPKIPGKAWIG